MEEKPRNAFTAFFSPPTSTPLIRQTTSALRTTPPRPPPTTPRTKPKITPRQRTPSPKKVAPPSHLTLLQSSRPPVLTTTRPTKAKVDQEEDYTYADLDYDYYYDQLVPEHERFFQVIPPP